jgi:hypothetical protein
METVIIYSGSTAPGQMHDPYIVRPKSSSGLQQKLLAEDFIKLDFESPIELNVTLKDYIQVFGRKYFINTMPVVTKKAARLFNYECTFESYIYDLSKVAFLDVDATGIHISHEFTLTGKLEDFGHVIKNNLRRLFGNNGWDCINLYAEDLNETKTLSFSEDTCLSALRKICSEYGVEYYFTENGPGAEYQFHLYFGLAGGLPVSDPFEYGKGKGLTEIKRKNASASNFITRVYAFGSSRNLGPNYRNFSPRLRLPAVHITPDIFVTKGVEIQHFPSTYIYGQTNAAFVQLQVPVIEGWTDYGQPMAGAQFNAGQGLTYTQPPKVDGFRVKAWNEAGKYVFSDGSYEGWENTGPEIDYVENLEAIEKHGVIEKVVIFDEIYPHRTGIVSGLGDSSLKFVDSEMFDLNEYQNGAYTYLLPGLSAKVHFNTGNLAGYEFEIWNYNHASREFTLMSYTDERGLVLPNNTSPAFQIGVGDEYVILDIKLPESYIEAAEQRLLEKATDWLNRYSNPQIALDVKVDETYISGLNMQIEIGNTMHVIDQSFNVNAIYRIVGITRNLIREDQFEVTLAEEVYRGRNANLREGNKKGGGIFKTGGSETHDRLHSMTSVYDHGATEEEDRNKVLGSNAETGLPEWIAKDSLDKSYTHYQGVPEAVWNVSHNLNKYPSVTIIDTSGNEMEGEIEYTDNNNLVLTFSAPFSGVAFLN